MPSAAATIRPQRHPVVGVLAMRGITTKSLAAQLGVHRAFLGPALNGKMPLSARLRREIARILDLPESDLFHTHPAVWS